MKDDLNLGLGFDSQSVDDSTRSLKKQARTLGSMFKMFLGIKKSLEDTNKQEIKVERNIQKINRAVGGLFGTIFRGLDKVGKKITGLIPIAGGVFMVFDKIKAVLGTIVGISLIPIVLPLKWIFKNGVRLITWATDFGARFQEIADSALDLERRFTRLSNFLGSESFANKVNKWQYDMLQNIPILRDDLDDFTVQMRELGLDPRNKNLAGVVGAALGPGHSFSNVMTAIKNAAGSGNDVQGLFEALGRTISPTELMSTLRGATTTQDRFTALLELLNKKYGDNIVRSNRLIGTSLGQINSFWSEFKEELVGTPQEGNLLWYIQQVFVDIKGWMKKNKAVLMSFAHSIQRVLGGVGRMIYNLFQGVGQYSTKAIGGIQSAAEEFKRWSIRAEGTLSLWAIKIKNVFKEASDEGLGIWDTMKKLWDEVFGLKTGNVAHTFWEKFKTSGLKVLEWLGEKISKIFGHQFKKGMVSVFLKDDGSLRTGTPGFIKDFHKSVKAHEATKDKTFTAEDIAAARKRVRMNSLGNVENSLKLASGGAITSYRGRNIATKNLTQKEIDTYLKFGFMHNKKDNKLQIDAMTARRNLMKLQIQKEIDELISKMSVSSVGMNPQGITGLGTVGLAPETIAVLSMIKNAAGVSSLQTNSNVRHGGSGNHAGGFGTDIQATDELMRKFGVTKAMMDPANGKFNLLVDKGGVRVAYEPPEVKGKGKGHFHVDVNSKNNKSGSFNSSAAESAIRDVIIHVHTQASDPVAVGREIQRQVKDVTGRNGLTIKKKATAHNHNHG